MMSSIGASSGMDMSAMRQAMQEKGQQKFASADADKSGGLSLDEVKSSNSKSVTNIEDTFMQLDSDGSGELSQDEMRSYRESQGGQKGGRGGGCSGGGGGCSGMGASQQSGGLLEALEQAAAEEDEGDDDDDILNALDEDDDGEISHAEYQATANQIQNEMMDLLLGLQEERA